MSLANLFVWTVQATVLVAVTAAGMRMLRRSVPSARLGLWQLTLVVAVLLPVIQPWHHDVVVTHLGFGPPAVLSSREDASPSLRSPRNILPSDGVLYALVAVAIARCILLGVGLYRLRRYRRNARPAVIPSPWRFEADLLTSSDISSPVTFGLLRPVILLPPSFESLAEPLRETVLCHEVLHIRRRDWLFTLCEELLKCFLWFQPGVWWAIHQIQLAREETVDFEVVEIMQQRDTYVDALILFAQVQSGWTPGFASPFVRRGHLKSRVKSLFQEETMSRKKTASASLAASVALTFSCWLVVCALPLRGSPQEVMDGNGVTVDLQGARLLHRIPVPYPFAALQRHVEGRVVAQVRLDESGNVADASISSGPEALRKAVLQSILDWHFGSDSANSTRHVDVDFVLPEVFTSPGQSMLPTMAIRSAYPASFTPPLGEISVQGLPLEQRQQLLSKMPVRAGDPLTAEALQRISAAVRDFDEHLSISNVLEGEKARVVISPRPVRDLTPPLAPRSLPAPSAQAIRLDAEVAESNLIKRVAPVYPMLARQAHVQGTVGFQATIGKDGTMQNLQVVSGPPLLVQAAMEAVRQWVYKPALVNGQPTDVITTLNVSFNLNEQ